MKKRVLTLFLALVMCLTLMPAAALATTNTHTREEAVAQAISMYWNPYDYDGVYGVQCVDMAVGYYRYLGHSISGNAYQYGSNRLPDGWKRYKAGETTPQPGDIVVWNPGMYWVNKTYGHIGVVVSVDDTYFHYVDYNSTYPTKDSQGYRMRSLDYFSYVIRPDWSESNSTSITDGTYTLTPACAPNARLDVANGSQSAGENVQIYTDNGTNAQKWDITSLGDGYYKLTAKCSGNVLDAFYYNISSGQNVIQYPWGGGSFQQWKFKDAGDGYYYISPRCNESLCLDVYSASSSDGANVQVYTANQTSAQKWKLTPVDTTTGQTTTGQTTTRTEYRYGRYVYTDYRLHTCWCETYMKKLFGSATLQYSEWSTTRYSPTGKGWTCGNCRGNHIGVGHYTDGKAWWAEYSLPDGDYFWEESRTVVVQN